ncbi:MAG: VTT domain-containing protein [Patescibacteria group bacterium]|mgnify:CR=1 FL=1
MFDLVSLIEGAGYLGLAAIIFAESGILIGFFLPGDSLLFTAGFLAAQGYLSIVPLIILLFAAAVLGDAVGYLFGKKVGPKIFSRPGSFWFRPAHIEKTKLFFERYGAKTILLSRFLPAVRTFAPIMAGVGGMRYRVFAIYNAVGALLWAGGITLLGYIFGQTIPNADRYIVPVVAAIIIVSILPTVWQIIKERRKV